MASTEPSPGGAPLPTGHPFGFDEMSMQLILRGVPARLYTFGDNPDVPWFPGKPILVFLGYANPKQAYERLDDDEKSSLKDLIAKKGPPRFEVGSFKEPTLGYNDLKATYISEPGLYTVILGSKKPEAKVFKKWVTSEVLPSIRRLGKYSFHDRRSPDDGAPPPPHRLQLEWDFTRKLEEFQLAVLENNKALVTQLADTKKALAVHDEASARRLEALEERLEASQRNTLRQLAAEFTKQLSVSVVFALQKLSRTLSQALAQTLSEALTRIVGEQLKQGFFSQTLSLCQHFREMVMDPQSKLVKSLRAAVRRPARRSTTDAVRFPPEQHATAEVILLKSITLGELAKAAVPELTYGALRRRSAAPSASWPRRRGSTRSSTSRPSTPSTSPSRFCGPATARTARAAASGTSS